MGYDQWGLKELDTTERLTLSLKLPQFCCLETLLWGRLLVLSLLAASNMSLLLGTLVSWVFRLDNNQKANPVSEQQLDQKATEDRQQILRTAMDDGAVSLTSL